MQLYSIEYDQVTKISTFDDKGKKVSDREERVRVAMHDLPLQTAQMYREKMTGLNLTVTAQLAGQEQPRSYERGKRKSNDRNTTAPAAASTKSSKQSQINQAAATGNLAAAINNRSK